jgi:geranylgeranyl diphosphate synthase, type II
MDGGSRIEQSLTTAIALAEGAGSPPRLAAAMRHAVFPRGGRIRPRLCLAVAGACGEDDPEAADAAAAAIELLHCASLAHDDMPCFDDADTRRGRPTVHRAFGEPLALLAGDALIVLAFQVLAMGAAGSPGRLAPLVATIGAAVGVPRGIVAGQAWECEPRVDLALYQREKTGALFAAATMAGAAASGHLAERWRETGVLLGEAYQIADDIRDATGDAAALGKPVGRDLALGRPNAVHALGQPGAVSRLAGLVEAAVDAVPACPGAAELRRHILTESQRLVPVELARHAA